MGRGCGFLQQANGNVHPFALDLGAEHPVVDLLPNFGANIAYATQINENGDIIVRIMDTRSAYLFNPGLYNGDPGVRASRNGDPQDFSDGDSPTATGKTFLIARFNSTIPWESDRPRSQA